MGEREANGRGEKALGLYLIWPFLTANEVKKDATY